jgi:hypothetical protein
MAQKRMFDKDITSKDSFTEMSSDAQSLYFHLGLHADDEGFISPKGIMRMISAPDDAIKILIAKKFVIPFESGVIVITDWKQNNWLDDRRVKPTQYQGEKKLLMLTSNKKYELSNGLASIVQSSIEEKSVSSSFKKKRPTYQGQQMRKDERGKWWVIPKAGGEWLEFALKEKDIEWL